VSVRERRHLPFCVVHETQRESNVQLMRHLYLAAKDRLGLSRSVPRSIEEHLNAAAKWLLVAQRATNDDGVAHSYDIRSRKWLPSYPETTGYIIPTLFDYAKYFNQPQYRDPALRMARWEAHEQLRDGGVRAGTMAAEVVVPTIFNTGQVVFGQARATLESDEPALRTSLERAADWLVAAQDSDGCWRRYPSPFTSTKTASYNTRCAFALCRAFGVIAKQSYLDAADRNVNWALSQSRDNGWLPGNCLTENADDSALTHTIAYSIRGILEVGIFLGKSKYVEHAQRMAVAVAKVQNADGSLPAYLTSQWTPRCRWTCVTGNAQMAINWQRLAQATGDSTARRWAMSANRFNMSLQDLDAADINIRGAIKGSHPIDGGYMTFRYPNWAAKFFMDALMLEHLHSIETIG
jgi:hypothetical protein